MFRQVDQLADKIKGSVAECKLQPFVGAEQVGDHRKGGFLDPGEEQGRTLAGNDPAVDLTNLEMGINLGINDQ